MAKLPTDTQFFEQYQIPEESSNGSQTNIENTPNGSVLGTGEFASPNFVSGRSGWRMDAEGNFEAVNGSFSGSLSSVSLNIPDETTASSFHVDSSGNVWWGTNLATGYTTAPAYILSTGAAHFENIEIGGTTIQYVITNSGIFSFGDGSDGNVTLSVNTTLTSDKYYDNLTIETGVTLNPAGYRIFVKNVLTLNGTAQISGNGNNGSNGINGGTGAGTNGGGAGGAGGAALADGYLKGSLGGAGGGAGGTGGNPGAVTAGSNGGSGTGTTNSLGTSSVGGAAGGQGATYGGGAAAPMGGTAGSGATVTTSNVKLIANWHLATLLDIGSTGTTIKYDNSASPGASGGGGGGTALVGAPANGAGGGGGGGGGSGTSGRIVAIYARSIIIGSNASITSNGGNGGNGGQGGAGAGTGTSQGGGGGGGGAGSGGNGGAVILVYNNLTNSGSVTASAGVAGTPGPGGVGANGGNTGSTGGTGNNGSAGTIYQFQLSL